jgi:hypothetical protein
LADSFWSVWCCWAKVLRHPLQPLQEGRRQRAADRAVHQQQALGRAVEAAAVVVEHHVLAEEVHHRPVRAPAEGLGQLEPVAVQRPQLDDADAVELRQAADALGLADAVGRHDLLQRPLAQHADGHQQQLLVLDHRLFLLLRQLLEQRLGVGHAARQFGEIDLQGAADGVDPRQRHVALGQHPLDAGLGHVQRARQVGVGHAGALEFVLQGLDEVDGGAHGGRSGGRY